MYRLRGVALPAEETVELYVDAGGRFSDGASAAAETLVDGGWIVPGLVDAHCHVGLGPWGPVDLEEADRQARIDRDAGALLIRDCGSPVDTTPLQARDDLPEIIRAGRHVARPKRYIPGLAVELDDPALLPEQVAEQAAAGNGWVKLVGDWIDRGVGDLAPLWPDEVLLGAIEAAHAAGARVTAHVFGTDALPGLIRAGIDCIEHGTGITDDTIELMLEHGTALVPTLINIDNFPGIADAAGKYPQYAKHMRDLYGSCRSRVGAAYEAGVPMFAGTDAGGMIAHGRIADEIEALKGIGMSPTAALGAASWDARAWLGRPALEHGASADLVCYRDDPRHGGVSRPDLVILRGRVWR